MSTTRTRGCGALITVSRENERGRDGGGKGNTLRTADAGFCPTDKRALPKWRYSVRQQALPLIRWETPYLAWMQEKLRTPALDSYFAITANLGTHTFFMVGLPMLFWCGYPSFGKGCGLTHIHPPLSSQPIVLGATLTLLC